MTVVTDRKFFAPTVRALGVLSILFVLCFGFARAADAVPRVDADASATLRVETAYDREPLSGMTFKLYHVGAIDTAGACILLEAYAQSGIDASSLTAVDAKAEDVRELATSLDEWIRERGLSADATAATDTSGQIDFGTLDAGFYLLQGASLRRDADTFTSASTLISLPQYDVESDAWSYTVSVQPKVAKTTGKTSDKQSGQKSADTSNEASARAGLLSALRRMGFVATGDNAPTLATLAVLVAAGVAFCCMGWRCKAKTEKPERKS